MHVFERLDQELPPRWNWSATRTAPDKPHVLTASYPERGLRAGPTDDPDQLIAQARAAEDQKPAIEADSLSSCPECGARDWDEAQGNTDEVRACCRQCFCVVVVDTSTMRFAGEQLALDFTAP